MAGKPDAQNRCVAEFFNFLSDPKVQAANHQRTGYLPVTLKAYELTRESGYYDKNPGADVAVKQMLKTTDKSRGIRLGNLPAIRTIVDEEFEKIWSGKTTSKAALDAVVARGNAELEKFERQQSRK
jgi:sn-glycerol 3-phosphate transport system substrate-binding protein